MTNKFPGLARGPIDHQSSSVINVISDGSIDMGAGVILDTTIETSELLPRVKITALQGDPLAYGVAVGGDVDGIYGDGTDSTDDSTRATNAAGQGVVVVTQGRCLAKVNGQAATILVGSKLTFGSGGGHLRLVDDTIVTAPYETVIAIALQGSINTSDMIAVDVQREGLLNAGTTS